MDDINGLGQDPFRNSILASTTINVPTDGVYAFEFKGYDSFGNVNYSGQSATNGIEDDWMMKKQIQIIPNIAQDSWKSAITTMV